MTKRKNRLFKSNFFIYGIISLLLHSFLLFFFLPNQNRIKKKLKPHRKFSIKLKKNKKKKIVKKIKKKEIDLKNKQIVDIARPNIEKEAKKAKFLAKYNNKTKKETKAKKKNKIIKKKVNKKDSIVRKKIKLNPKKNLQKTKKPKKQKEPQKKKISKHEPKLDKNAKANFKKNIVKKTQKKVKLKFSDLQFSQMLNSASNDYLKDTKEGDYTSLNTLAYEYTGYFIKIKNRVSQNWNPEAAYQKYDPYRKIYGIKDRYTVLLITIGKKGYLKKIKVQKSCGLAFLDKEAITAFEKGQPYNIVPKGLLKGKENFTIQFGFYVDNPSSPRVFYLK